MLIGAMNHPREEVIHEIRWMAEMGLDFIDLSFEPPEAAVWRVDVSAIRAAVEDHGLRVVGHTAYYLPMASPFESLRQASVDELKRCLEAFAAVGAKWMNLHPDRHAPMHDRAFYIERNLQSIGELLEFSRGSGVGIMVENLPEGFNSVRQLSDLLDPLPEVGLHLDIGHANLLVEVNTTTLLLDAYGQRLKHVHLHDNKGGAADLHLPLGTGTLDFRRHVRELKACGYDSTITLEVFSPDRHFLAYSRDVLRSLWDAE